MDLVEVSLSLGDLNNKMLDHFFDDKCKTCLSAARTAMNINDNRVYFTLRHRLSCGRGRKILDQFEQTRNNRSG